MKSSHTVKKKKIVIVTRLLGTSMNPLKETFSWLEKKTKNGQWGLFFSSCNPLRPSDLQPPLVFRQGTVRSSSYRHFPVGWFSQRCGFFFIVCKKER